MKYIMSEILSKENINTHSEEELDKFITYLQGDLRRGLNELQASSASKRTLQYQIDMNMKPYSEIITMINENNYENALEKVHKLIYDSTDMKTICINLHTTVLETESDSNYKFKMLRIIGETEWRSNNMNPKVLASWMVGQMIK
jgi:DNA polymerase III delta prime subunit